MKFRDNRLLAMLDEATLHSVKDELEHVRLRQGQSLHKPMAPITHIYFFTAGLSSEMAIDSGGQRIEVGCIGDEGLAGCQLSSALIDHRTDHLWKPTAPRLVSSGDFP